MRIKIFIKTSELKFFIKTNKIEIFIKTSELKIFTKLLNLKTFTKTNKSNKLQISKYTNQNTLTMNITFSATNPIFTQTTVSK